MSAGKSGLAIGKDHLRVILVQGLLGPLELVQRSRNPVRDQQTLVGGQVPAEENVPVGLERGDVTGGVVRPHHMERIRPQLQADGGDVEVTEIDDEKGIVYVALQGACVGCPMSSLTISQGIERVLKEHVPGVERVLPDLSGQENKEIEVTVLDDDGNIAGTKKVSVDELMGE